MYHHVPLDFRYSGFGDTHTSIQIVLAPLVAALLTSTLFSNLHLVRADPVAVNITIDDQYGDVLTGVVPTYSPSGGVWSQGANCSLCSARPNASLATFGTWHDSTWEGGSGDPYSIAMTFNGRYFFSKV